MLKRFIGTKEFYKKLMAVSLPIVIQQLVTASVQLVDNVMVGSLGESAISSVAVVNQLFFVMMLLVFGLLGGAGIYTAQFFGSKDYQKLKETFRFKVTFAAIIAAVTFLIASFFGEQLIRVFTNTPSTVQLGLDYLAIAKFTVIPMYLSLSISTTFREIGNPRPLMRISIFAILTNTVLNYILIFGNLGAPALGVEGAAYATLIARTLEFGLLLVLLRRQGQMFATKIWRVLKINRKVLISILIVAAPMMLNELMWSTGQTMFLKAYSTRGDAALAAFNISNTISQLVFVIFSAMSTAVAVLVGNTLGANKLEEAKDNSVKLVAFSVFVALISGIGLVIASPFIPNIYDISESTKQIVTFNIIVNGLFIPVYAYNVGIFFVLRSGGDTRSTLLMDALFMWVVSVPIALVMAYFTSWDVRLMFLLVQATDFPKALFATVRYKKGHWVKNLAVSDEELAFQE